MNSGRDCLFPILVLLAGTLILSVGCATCTLAAQDTKGRDLGPYAIEPQPLTPAQCAQCHPSQFGDLKEAGGQHRLGCRDCHDVFHAYNPRRDNYSEIMPKCSGCHDQPHGDRVTDCLSCHSNPHSPFQIEATDQLGSLCSECHAAQAGQLQDFPSAHTELGCQSCHYDGHGSIPECLECHSPHYPKQPTGACSACHPVHKPLQIAFSLDARAETCKVCHDGVYEKWHSSKAKHGKVNCTVCHEEHGVIPSCRDCHEPPHGKKLLEMYPDCLTCHLDVHDMPVKDGGQ